MSDKGKLLLIPILALVLTGFLVSNVSANTLILDLGAYHSGIGGEFNAYSATLNPVSMGYSPLTMANVGHGVGFETFCLEYNEEFVPGGTYNYAISQAAIHGGVPGGSDPLSLGTAWLYLNFAEGNLPGYDFTNAANRTNAAGMLQNTIWWLEGERADPGNGNSFRNLVITQFGSAANAMADNNGFYGVAVLNLYYLDGSDSQDQLVLVPDSGTTSMLLSLGLASLFLFNRKVLPRRQLSVA
ncbi:MAG TPA: VPDSG-CTERM sorting domain-containing protein [Candidatus Acidoferrum sp.]|nr:VPDSG-CTERM sorting domain-containing protein [Candidatus Acidoferrum sp.]